MLLHPAKYGGQKEMPFGMNTHEAKATFTRQDPQSTYRNDKFEGSNPWTISATQL